MQKKNLDGERFNRWTIISEGTPWIRKKTNWKEQPTRNLLCRCDCWTIKTVAHWNIVNWNSKSCWCHHKEICKWLMEELHKTQKWSGNPNWKWWIAYHNQKINSEARNSNCHKDWAKAVKIRDNYKCLCCNSNKQPEAHHLENFSSNKELRFDLNNWVTMCRICHNKFHKEYWRFDNTPEQFKEFLSSREEQAISL